VSSLQPLSAAAGQIFSLALLALLGLPAGRLAAWALHEANLHWSWALVALGVSVTALSRLGELGPGLLVACTSACLRGARCQREELDAGGEPCERARGRVTPIATATDLLRRLDAHVEAHGWGRRGPWPGLRSGVRRGSVPARRDCVSLGVDERGLEVTVPLAAGRPAIHTLVLGATGSGKTVTQALLATGAIRRGMAAVAIDPKGDPALCEALCAAAHDTGRAFLAWNPEGELVYNPCAHGSPSEIADRVLAGERFTEPHYLRQAQRYVGHAVGALRARGGELSLREIAAALDPDRLEAVLREASGEERDAGLAYLDSLTQRQRAELAGVRDRISILCESDVGRWLDPTLADSAPLDLHDAVRAGAVVYFGLRSDSRPLTAQMLGAAIVLDLQGLVSATQGSVPSSTLIAIDEFSALAAPQVVGLFGRARSAGFSLLLATQELADLRLPGAERTLDQVLGNLSLLIAHRQVLPASCELLADLAGRRDAWRVARHSDRSATRTLVQEPVLRADKLAGLQPGQAAVFALADGRGARIARVHSTAVRA